ncbi:MAG: asparagine--tRNA ligase [Bacteroidetes Order II. Incertae sedis bacterium]|jgi:asparaginyl-tRNA synthetase|nr:asparagine--tRNA ligase [Bacteroidetes Order II. bacterium]MBT5248890.1 asparagine--tRNA ligase [Bacteroidetes Order II. bacterium]MBT6199343.1 asparagine--tRNA ligase [Bacteroidetes Order II. bacterium]MBT6424338.1 asparagine--tRNA ligase [Bacteroidetes Order II. bacterium]MBT6581266.1 asparagine--tRNA ligase [Bacteroidetes Order II. bacterium]
MTPDHVDISALKNHEGQSVTLRGWLYNKRSSKGLHFLVMRDGTGLSQCVVNQGEVDESSWQAAESATQESSIELKGLVRADEKQVGGYEIQVTEMNLIHQAEEYPITPKEHGVDFLMNHRHLWLRSRRQWAILRIRNSVIMSIHNFFQERGFLQMDAPILTGTAVEGTSTLFEMEYFGRSAYLTQSGQLHGEAMAMAFGKIYTFGPTFRAEKSKTRRHLTEFWMIEPEMAFYDLEMTMQLAEEMLSRIVSDALANCQAELEVLDRDLEPLKRSLSDYPRVSYDEAVEILHSEKTRKMVEDKIESLKSEATALTTESAEGKATYGQAKKWQKRKIDVREGEIQRRQSEIEEELRNLPKWLKSAQEFEWGNDFGGSDETLITWHYDRPIIVHRFPHGFKAFYMKRDPEDDRLALGMDVLAPEGYGEIVGGGERADDLGFLQDQVKKHGLPEEAFKWYFDLRRYGSVQHAGYGLGLERTVTWICGIHHLRETIPFARTLDRLYP